MIGVDSRHTWVLGSITQCKFLQLKLRQFFSLLYFIILVTKSFIIEFQSNDVFHLSQVHISHYQCHQFLSHPSFGPHPFITSTVPQRQTFHIFFFLFFTFDIVDCAIVNERVSCLSITLFSFSTLFQSRVTSSNYNYCSRPLSKVGLRLIVFSDDMQTFYYIHTLGLKMSHITLFYIEV